MKDSEDKIANTLFSVKYANLCEKISGLYRVDPMLNFVIIKL